METKTKRYIDLNLVVHFEGDEEEEDGDEMDDEVGGVSGESGGEFESESLLGDNEGAGEMGLVTSLDDIPEEEFLKMIGDDVIAGSHDLGDVTNQSEDVTKSGNMSDSDDELASHDLDDVTKSSHDLNDVTKGSHDHKLLALILTPTRELALQVKSHICDAAKYTGIKVMVLHVGKITGFHLVGAGGYLPPLGIYIAAHMLSPHIPKILLCPPLARMSE